MKTTDEPFTVSAKDLYTLLQSANQRNDELVEVITALKQQIDKLQSMLFGQRSERQKRKKKTSDNEADKSSSLGTSNSGNDKSIGTGRGQLPANLPRKVMKHDLAEDERECQNCRGKLQCIGKDVSEQLEVIPLKLYVIEHRRYKYACRCCQKITMAKLPAQPIDKGLAGPGLLAELLINKYQEHMPLYRQSLRFERYGCPIARSTLCDWVSSMAFQLKPIVEAMAKQMLVTVPKIHSDDTTIPVLAKEKTHTGRLWVYIGMGGHAPPTVIYRYSKTRSGREPQGFLKHYRGYLQADAYSGYDKCFVSGDIIEVACNAHARRYYVDALKASSKDGLADTAVEYFAQLYQIEKSAKTMSDAERYYYRKRLAKPLIKQFKCWLQAHVEIVLPKSPLGKAMKYHLNHWDALANYCRDGTLSIDNNAAERAMKSVVLGRKNYLFAGSHNGADNAAIIYSIIETCKALGINTFYYLSDVFRRLPTTLNADIQSLMPANWKPVS